MHVVVPDGLFGTDAVGAAVFHRLPPPTDYDVEQLLHATARRVLRMLAKKVGDDADLDADEALAALEASSLQPGPRRPDVDTPTRRLAAGRTSPYPRLCEAFAYQSNAGCGGPRAFSSGLQRLGALLRRER